MKHGRMGELLRLGLVVAACWGLVYLAFAPVAHAAVTHGDNTNATIKDGEGTVVLDGTKWRVVRGTAGGGLTTTDESRDREYSFFINNIYNDTLSVGAARRDSLAVPIDVHNVKSVTWLVRLEGAQAAAGNVYRIGLTPRWHTALVADSLNTYFASDVMQAGNNPWAAPDSVGLISDAAINVAYENEVTLRFMPTVTLTSTNGRALWNTVTLTVPSGVVGASFVLRALSGPSNAAFRVRVKATGRAL